MSDTTITIPASVLIDGRWRDATWTAERRVDTDTVQYTASVRDLPTSVAIFITDNDLRVLRKMAGEDAQQPEDIKTLTPAEAHLHAIEREISQMRVGVQGEFAAYRRMIENVTGRLRNLETGLEAHDLLRRQSDERIHRITERLTTLAARCGELGTTVSKLQAEHVTPADLQAAQERMDTLEARIATAGRRIEALQR